MKTIKFFSLLFITSLFFASCGSRMKVTTDYDRSVDFSKYKTFGIYKFEIENQTISDLNRNRMYSTIKSVLRAKGLTESSNPDLWINSLAVVDTRESHSSTTTTTGMGMGMGMGGFHRPYMWGGPMMGSSFSHTQHNVEIYHKGSVFVDIIDAKTNNLVWHAAGNRKIDKKFRKNPDAKIFKYIDQLFSTFPPSSIIHTTTIVK